VVMEGLNKVRHRPPLHYVTCKEQDAVTLSALKCLTC
jgi:hypothetical protein